MGRIGPASGVLVGPDLVLTAKHVGVDSIYLPGFGYFAPIGPGVAHPNADIRLYRIDTRGLKLPFVPILAGGVAPNTPVTMVGYGLSGILNKSATGYDMILPRGTRRKAAAIIDRTELVSFGQFHPGYSLISILRENGQGALANGDSGGGIFETIGSATFLVGINSFAALWGKGRPYEFSSSSVDYFGSGSVALGQYAVWLRSNGAIVVPRPWFPLKQ